MKIEKPISSKNVPNKEFGNARKAEYDELVEKILSLPKGKSLPIKLEYENEYSGIYSAIRLRSKDITLTKRGLTLYAERK